MQQEVYFLKAFLKNEYTLVILEIYSIIEKIQAKYIQ